MSGTIEFVVLGSETAPLTKTEAAKLTSQIKLRVAHLWQLIAEAYSRRAWTALGYASWDDYCSSEFGSSRIRLPREERTEVIASLRESGLSLRAIEAATGVSRPTIIKDLADEQVVNSLPPGGVTESTPGQTDRVAAALAKAAAAQDSPAHESTEPTITGVDGKTYKKSGTKKKPQPATVVENTAVDRQEQIKLSTWYHGRRHEFASWDDVYAALSAGCSNLGSVQAEFGDRGAVKIAASDAAELRGNMVDLHAALLVLLDNRPTGDDILLQSDELDRRAVEIVKDLFATVPAEPIEEEPDDGDTYTLWSPDVTITVTSRTDYEDLRPWVLSIYRRAIEAESERKAEWLEKHGAKKYDTEPIEYLRHWTSGSTDELDKRDTDVFGATYLRLNPLILIGEMATWIAQEFDVDSITVAEQLLDAYKIWDYRITESIRQKAGDLGE